MWSTECEIYLVRVVFVEHFGQCINLKGHYLENGLIFTKPSSRFLAPQKCIILLMCVVFSSLFSFLAISCSPNIFNSSFPVYFLKVDIFCQIFWVTFCPLFFKLPSRSSTFLNENQKISEFLKNSEARIAIVFASKHTWTLRCPLKFHCDVIFNATKIKILAAHKSQ